MIQSAAEGEIKGDSACAVPHSCHGPVVPHHTCFPRVLDASERIKRPVATKRCVARWPCLTYQSAKVWIQAEQRKNPRDKEKRLKTQHVIGLKSEVRSQ
jgi:hypothetical protein